MKCKTKMISPFENSLNFNRNIARIDQIGCSNTKVAGDQENSIEAKYEGFSESEEVWIKFMLPIFTASEANGGVKKSYMHKGKKCYKTEHWTEKHRRTKLQKGTVFLALRPHRESFKLPCLVKLTRYAPRKLDKRDNLPMSLKYVLDAVCAVITNDYCPGRADSSEEIDVIYDQVTSKEYGVMIEILNL